MTRGRRAGGPLPRAARRRPRGALHRSGARRARSSDALADPAPARLDDGGVDPLRLRRRAGRRARAARRQPPGASRRLQLDYAQRYGVASLKIRHHAQLGYVVEAPAAAVEKLRAHPGSYLAAGHGQRRAVLHRRAIRPRPPDRRGRRARRRARERAVVRDLVAAALAQAGALAACAGALAVLDVAQSAARLAEPGTWCRPDVDRRGGVPHRGGPASGGGGGAGRISAAFVPNDCDLSPERRVLLLTGPNMAGKSTFLRQNALAVVLAQAGLPVPAESARIGVVDRLFSRVGAADDLARGRSTFMVEMTETAAILHQAGPRSLVVVDEIGRGTATLDGLAIAWAVLEALHSTHPLPHHLRHAFPRAGRLSADRLPRLAPHTMRVKEWKGSVVFLHEVGRGRGGAELGRARCRAGRACPPPSSGARRSLLAKLEKNGGPLGMPEAPAAQLPLFAAASRRRTRTADRTRCATPWPGSTRTASRRVRRWKLCTG